MTLDNDIVQIKAAIGGLAIGLGSLCEAIAELSDKIDGIKSSGNKQTELDLMEELTHLFRLLAQGDKVEAWRIVLRLTGCTLRDAKKIVEGTYESDND